MCLGLTYQKSVSRTQILSHTLDLKIHNHTLTKNFSQLRLNFDLNCELKTQLSTSLQTPSGGEGEDPQLKYYVIFYKGGNFKNDIKSGGT